MDIRIVSSLLKVFPDETGDLPILADDVAARNEIYSFQAAIRRGKGESGEGRIRVEAAGALALRIRSVEPVASLTPAGEGPPDGDYQRTAPGLYPDLLAELDDGCFRLYQGQWRLLWCTVRIGGAPPGKYPLTLSFSRLHDRDRSRDGELGSVEFTLEVLDFELPRQELLRLEWLHCDCLGDYYRVPVWSEEHWRIVGNFIRNAFDHGVNVLYTPLWTPPLDTAVGLERPTCQLLGIEGGEDGPYRFDFSRLERWIDSARAAGYQHFAMSHLFTQWGAAFTPKIMVRGEDGEERRRFGWEVPAAAPRYREFLEALLPPLLAFLRRKGIGPGQCFFSVSDEPPPGGYDSYRDAVRLVKPLLEEYPTLEALSDYDFFRRGLVDIPVPANNHIGSFAGKVERRWCYYCCGQQRLVPNRFFSMPLRRVRIMGILAYVYDLEGFLHWGFNFYHAMLSRYPVDPFMTTDAGGGFPSGNAFLVYPGRDGDALDSIRHESFREGLQDLRALRALESKIGRAKVLELLHEGLPAPLAMDCYPRSDSWLTGVRKRIYRLLSF